MQPNIKLRPFEPKDLEQVMYINRTCLPENYPSYFFMDHFKRFPETFLVAEDRGVIVGYIMCRIETGLLSFKPLGILKRGHTISIAVLPEYRRRGIGYALVSKALEAMAVKYGAKECYLEVRVSNTPAINLYKKLGFEIKKIIKGYYADGEDAYLMVKKLVHPLG